jgi:predicted TPR repeat methyltransferase
MLLANYEDFENGGLYDNYRRYKWFAVRAKYLADKYDGTFLIAGCGWGFLVDELRLLGREAWGCDLSDYAIRSAGREVPDSISYISKADAMDARQLAKIGPGTFDVAVSEDMLTVLDNPGQMLRVDRALRQVAKQIVHIVSVEDLDAPQDKRVRWYDEGWWQNQFRGANVVAAQSLQRGD